MENTTIALRKETKQKIANFGSKSDSYDEIINKIYNMAVKTQLRELLMSSKNTVTIDEAIKEAKKKWPKSK